MRTIVTACAAALVAVAMAPPAYGATDTTGCNVRTTSALEIEEGFYLHLAVSGTTVVRSLWAEENGVDGLQTRESACLDGRTIPADQCVSYLSASGDVLACPNGYLQDEIDSV